MKILITVWLTAIGTFAVTSIYILSNEARINVPGELGESFSLIGVVLLVVLIAVTFVTLILKEMSK